MLEISHNNFRSKETILYCLYYLTLIIFRKATIKIVVMVYKESSRSLPLPHLGSNGFIIPPCMSSESTLGAVESKVGVFMGTIQAYWVWGKALYRVTWGKALGMG